MSKPQTETTNAPALSGKKILDIAKLVLAVKFVILIFGSLGYQIVGNFGQKNWLSFFEIWNCWDTLHYLKLAQYGYEEVFKQIPYLITFPPLYPWMIRFFAYLTAGNFLFSAFLVSGISSVVAGLLFYRLIRMDEPEEIADRAVWFLLIFPTSFFLHIGYTESLFFALMFGSFLAARSQKWIWAGILAALMILTRHQGVVMIPILMAEAFWHSRSKSSWHLKILGIVLPSIGIIVYLGLNIILTGEPLAFLIYKKQGWHVEFEWPWIGFMNSIQSLSWRKPSGAQIVVYQEIFFALLALVMTILCFVKLRLSYGLWMAANLFMVTSIGFISSVPRYTLALFPMYILFAKLKPNSIWARLLTVWCLLLMSIFLTQFVLKRWAY